MILLSAVILYKAGSHRAVEDIHLKFTILAGTHSIDDFNAKVKVAILK